MGYNLYIGEAKSVVYLEDRHAHMGVEVIDGEEFGAPENSSGNHSNFIYPSYLGWSKFCDLVGLYSVFYAPCCYKCLSDTYKKRRCEVCEGGRKTVYWIPEGKGPGQEQEGIIYNHAGAVALSEDHLTAFRTARAAWLNRSEEERQELGVGEDGVDYVLRRLDWLVFWSEWALENCDYPTFANS